MGQPVSKQATTAPFENYHIHSAQMMQPPLVHGPHNGLAPVMYVNSDFNVDHDALPPSYQGPRQGGPRQEFYPPPGPNRPRPIDRPLPRRACGPPPRRGGGGGGGGGPGRGCGGGGGGGMDEMDFFEDDTFDFDPFAEDRQPRMYTREELGQGRAQELINDVRQRAQRAVEPAREQRYRAGPPRPPQQYQQPQQPQQPRITKHTTYVDEPAGYLPPNQARTQGYAQQGYSQQQQPVVIQAPQQQQQQQQSSQQPIVLTYDPATGAINQPAAQTQQQYAVQAAAPAAQPVMYAYQQPQQQQQPMVSYLQQPMAGYQQQPMAMAYPQMQGYMMPQMQNPAQPIVIPMQVHSG